MTISEGHLKFALVCRKCASDWRRSARKWNDDHSRQEATRCFQSALWHLRQARAYKEHPFP